MSDTFLLLDFFPVMNFHLEEIKRRSLAQIWCPDLSNQERNQGAKIGSCIAMEVEILKINVSMQKSFRMEILSSDSDSSHRKALDCNIQFRNSFKFWKIEFGNEFPKFPENSEIAEKKTEFHRWNFGVQKSEFPIPKALPHNFLPHLTSNAHRIPNGAKHSPHSGQNVKSHAPGWRVTISTKIMDF